MKFFVVMMLTCSAAFAQETIVSYNENSLPVLNEELRQSSEQTAAVKKSVAAVRNQMTIMQEQITALSDTSSADSLVSRVAALEAAVAAIDMPSLGARESKSNNTTYQAATDGFVVATNNDVEEIRGYTDSSSSPTTIVAIFRIDTGGATFGLDSSITFPVKAGDYWKVTGCDSVRWIPLS